MKITRKMLVISIIFIFALTHYSKSLFTCLIRDFVFATFSWFFVNILDFQNGRKTTKIREIDFLLIYWIFKINKKQQKNKRKKKYAKSNFWWIYWILKIDENRQNSAKLIFYELSDFKNRRKYTNLSTLQKRRGKKSAKTNFFRRFVIPFSDFWTKIGHFA